MERITHNGVALAFEDAGKGAPPLLLIHDLGRDHASLRPQLEHFRGRHRVVAVDLPGHGQSGPLPRPYTPASFADDLAWLCYELGVYRPVAVGHGVGGVIAVELAGRCPSLLAAIVALDASLQADARTHDHNNVMVWDGTTAARCGVPMLYIATRALHASVEELRQLCPGVVAVSVRPGHLSHGEMAKRVNAEIDAFLGTSLAPCLPAPKKEARRGSPAGSGP